MTTANDTSRPHHDNVLVRTWRKLWIGLTRLVSPHSCATHTFATRAMATPCRCRRPNMAPTSPV